MITPKTSDYILLTILSIIWASAFFNIKIATYSYGPMTIAFFRILLGTLPVLLICFYNKIKIEAFSKDWLWFASIGTINLVIPFFFNRLWCSKSAKQSCCYSYGNDSIKRNYSRTYIYKK